MNAALKWKLVAGFLLVFIAGGVTGAFFAANMARHYFTGPPDHALIAQRMRERLQMQLRLTPEQMQKISPIIERSAAQLEEIRMDSARKVRQTFAETHREMAANLTEEQRQRLDQMRHRHQHWLEMHRRHVPAATESPSPSPSASVR